MAFEQLTARQAVAWAAAPWERAAPQLAGIHDDVVSRVGVRAGEQWLDLATGPARWLPSQHARARW
jgi:hypothetical protein